MSDMISILQENNRYIPDDKTVDICGSMPGDESKKLWGDQHYAEAVKKYFEKSGYKANIVSYDRWLDRSRAKFVIVLRGLYAYYPPVTDGRKFIMWNISHSNDISIGEYNLYDHVFFASERLKKNVGEKIRPGSGALLQCTDEEVMTYREDPDSPGYELLFIGNSRGFFRPILKDLLPTEYKLTVYGSDWDNFPVRKYVVQKYMDNEKIGQAYHDAKILLNDHWDDMRENGLISNRIFDALAAQAFVISDYMPEIDEIFSGAVVTYRSKEDLKEKIDYYMAHPEERKTRAERGQAIVLKDHTFRQRVQTIVEVMENLK